MNTVTRAFLRYPLRRRGLSILQLLGIACGVAAAIGMALSARSALSSFSQAVEFLKGRSTHSLERPAGPMEESLLPSLMSDPAVDAFSPVLDRRLRLGSGDLVRLLGIDPFLDRKIRPRLSRIRPEEAEKERFSDRFSFFLEEKAILMDNSLARQLGLHSGDWIQTARGRLRLAGTFPNPSGEPLIVMDIAHAQRLLGMSGKLDRVDLILSDEAGFRSRWARGFLIQSGQEHRSSLSDMLRAFRLNLQALSLLALFVGIFLIYNTAMFAVVSRRRDAGILRSLGAGRKEIFFAFLSEILILGALGGALGGLGGYFLSRFLTHLVTDTISNLYFFLLPVPPGFSWWILPAGSGLGCSAGLLGGLYPLIELMRVNPVQALQGRTATRREKVFARKAALLGAGILTMSLVLLAVSPLHVYVGFATAFGQLLGFSFLTGLVLILLAPPLKKLMATLTGLPGKVAAGNIRKNLSRTAVAVAAFMVALSMAIGLGMMIGSFRQSLIWWMNSQLRGEIYIGEIGEFEVPQDFYEEIRSLPGVGGVDRYRNVQIQYRGTPIYVSSVDASILRRYARFGWMKGGDENWGPVLKGAVIVSESFYRRFGLGAGDSVTLDGFPGAVHLKIAAVFYDYTTEHGLIMMDRSTYFKVFHDPTINNIAVFMDPGNPQKKEILADIVRRVKERGLPVASRQKLHRSILDVFDATFSVTRSMRVLAILVAFFGIAGALLTLFMERQKEFGIYRALGFSTGQVAAMTLLEGMGMGLIAYILSTGVGTALAWVLIRVINLQSFHWTIFFHFSWDPYWLALVTAVLASLGAALYPIGKVYQTYPQMQIREE